MNYRVLVILSNESGGQPEYTIPSHELADKLKELVPECDIDAYSITNSIKKKYFRHYMPINRTICKNSKQNSTLFKNGNRVKVYISRDHNY